jgi:hypothetical protein
MPEQYDKFNEGLDAIIGAIFTRGESPGDARGEEIGLTHRIRKSSYIIAS